MYIPKDQKGRHLYLVNLVKLAHCQNFTYKKKSKFGKYRKQDKKSIHSLTVNVNSQNQN